VDSSHQIADASPSSSTATSARFAMHAIKWIVVTMSFLNICDRRVLDPVPYLKKKHSKGAPA
jgi:hypothetical protein